MDLVVDATIVFTGIMGTGVTKEIIFSRSVNLHGPKALFDEVEEHTARIKVLSGLSSSDFGELLGKLRSAIKLFPRSEYEPFINEANKLISDPDDTEYLALSLSIGKCPIWSNDPHFKKQSSVGVFTTNELVEHLKSKGLL